MPGKSERLLLLDYKHIQAINVQTWHDRRWKYLLKSALICALLWSLYTHKWPRCAPEDVPKPRIPLKNIPARLKSFQDCSIRSLFADTNLDFLSTAHTINSSEFVERRDRLARALVEDGLDAFIVEPSYTLQYYVNVCHCSNSISDCIKVGLLFISPAPRSRRKIGSHGSPKSDLF